MENTEKKEISVQLINDILGFLSRMPYFQVSVLVDKIKAELAKSPDKQQA